MDFEDEETIEFLNECEKLYHALVGQDDVDTREEGIATWVERYETYKGLHTDLHKVQ